MTGESADQGRRALFKLIAGASAAGVVAVAGPAGVDEAQAYQPPGDQARARYQETEHVKAFYRTNGYETKNKK